MPRLAGHRNAAAAAAAHGSHAAAAQAGSFASNASFPVITPTNFWEIFFPPAPVAAVIPYVSVAKAAAEQAVAGVASFGVADTASHLLSALPQLSQLSHLASLKVVDTAQLHVSFSTFTTYRTTLDKLVSGESLALAGLSVAQGSVAQSDPVVGGFTVTDTAAHVLAGLETLNGFSHLSAVKLSDGGSLALSHARYLADAAVVGKLPAGSLHLSAVTALGAAAAAQDSHVAHFTVSDTLANIGLALDGLEAAALSGRLSGISVTDSGQTLDLSPGRFAADHDALALLSGSFHLTQNAPPFTINLVYNSSMANAPAGLKAALNVAVDYFEGLFSSAASVTIRVGYGEFDGQSLPRGVLGQADARSGVTVSYDVFKAALAAHASTSEQLTTLANMGPDPTRGGNIFVPGAEAKALGLLDPYAAGIDAVMGFAADARGTLWNYDTANRAVAGKYDFLGVVEHELAHALGRVAYLGDNGLYTPLDLTRYSAPGQHVVAGTRPAYFSIDGGVTNLNWYATSSDLGDWASSAGADAASAFLASGVANQFSHTDVVQMNVLGYALA